MMPPKKSKAARAEKATAEKASASAEKEAVNGVEDTPPAAEPVKDKGKKDEQKSEEHKNIFEETVVEGKRKRTIPPSEAKLIQWVSDHLEEKEDVSYHFSLIYGAFMDECIADGLPGYEDLVFRKELKERFPKGYAFKEESPYNSKIKPIKRIAKPKVQGDTFKLKAKEVMERTFKDLGNPRSGVRFHTIRQYIAGKYPALQVDIKPNYVINALKSGVRHDQITLMRGMGKSGVYRLYVEGEESESSEEEEEKPKAKKEKKEGEEDGEGSKSEDTEEEKTEGEKQDGEEGEKKEGEGEDGEKKDTEKKKKKRKKSIDPEQDFVESDTSYESDNSIHHLREEVEALSKEEERIKLLLAVKKKKRNIAKMKRAIVTGRSEKHRRNNSSSSNSSRSSSCDSSRVSIPRRSRSHSSSRNSSRNSSCTLEYQNSINDENDDHSSPGTEQKSEPPASREGKIIHSAPKRIEDTFPLAITFGTEPKLASGGRIRNYILKHYPDADVSERLRPCLEKGAEKGFWIKHTNGAGYELTVDEFDPTDDDDMIGKVVNAIMACTEPKQCSVALLKNYVVEFHPGFGVADRQHKFKQALERAELSGDLQRLTGIGASGSFQLAYTFQPSPAVLAAQDTASDYEADTDLEEEAEVCYKTERGQIDITAFQDAYVPRPTKRRGKARESTKISFFQRQMVDAEETERKQPAARAKRPASSDKGRKKKYVAKSAHRRSALASADESQSDDSDDQDYSNYGKKQKKKKKGIKQEPEEYKSDELYKPRPSSSRGGRARTPPPPKKKTPAKKTPAKGGKKGAKADNKRTPTKASLKAKPKALAEESEEEPQEEEEEEEEEAPVEVVKATPGRKRGGSRIKTEPDTPTPSKRASRKASPGSAKLIELSDSEQEEKEEHDDEEDVATPPPPKKAKKGKKGKGKRR